MEGVAQRDISGWEWRQRCHVKAKSEREGGKACLETERLTETAEGSEKPTLGVPVRTS